MASRKNQTTNMSFSVAGKKKKMLDKYNKVALADVEEIKSSPSPQRLHLKFEKQLNDKDNEKSTPTKPVTAPPNKRTRAKKNSDEAEDESNASPKRQKPENWQQLLQRYERKILDHQ
jgi:hypothetical protein